ncbi:hypothetical protein DBR39_00825 [Chryseobacterium sp. KBW03]|nr:hypothetical protein DBR39_00825 [Chryseobacterium sp. KBW03]
MFVALKQKNFLNVHKIFFFNAQFSKVKEEFWSAAFIYLPILLKILSLKTTTQVYYVHHRLLCIINEKQ